MAGREGAGEITVSLKLQGISGSSERIYSTVVQVIDDPGEQGASVPTNTKLISCFLHAS
jgi:hypothetical protein